MAHAAPASGSETVLYTFTGAADGGNPRGSLVADANGALYGTTTRAGNIADCQGTGCGTVYMLAPPASGQTAWTYTTLYSFNGVTDGAGPMAGLAMDALGNLYGTTRQGCGAGCGGYGCGTVFMLSPPSVAGGAWSFSTIYSFSGPDGAMPLAEITIDPAGNLLGTTSRGGGAGHGGVFRLDVPVSNGWTFEQLYSFTGGTDGGYASGPVIPDATGAIYGTTAYGGTAGTGLVFQLAPPPPTQSAWSLNVLYNFPGNAGGSYPRSPLIFDSAGNLYGSATNIVFSLAPQAGGPWPATILHTFSSFADANIPFAGLAEVDAPLQTTFYGTAGYGTTSNQGAVYALAAPSATNPSWSESVLYAFTGGSDGGNPFGGIMQIQGGALYGVTTFGGGATQCEVGCGVVYMITP